MLSARTVLAVIAVLVAVLFVVAAFMEGWRLIPLYGLGLIVVCAIVIGSEGRGISNELYGIAQDVAIPTTGVESLNAAVAASVLLYEARRQRQREAVRA